MSELDGRVAVVTGGTRGIGLATCRALAAAGATVTLTDRDAQLAASGAKELAAEFSTPVQGLGLDVTDTAAIGAVIRGVAREHGRLDVVVANAGVLGDALLGMVSAELVDTMLATNVAGTIHTVQAAGLGVAGVGAVPAGDRVAVYVEGADRRLASAAAQTLATLLRMHVSGFDVRDITALPLLSTGKIDYRALEALCES